MTRSETRPSPGSTSSSARARLPPARPTTCASGCGRAESRSSARRSCTGHRSSSVASATAETRRARSGRQTCPAPHRRLTRVARARGRSGPGGRSVASRPVADVVTMDKIVSLCRRRGFVFPSSEIYGGLGSAYDYGHYGVLLKTNVKARWLEAMVQERDDIVALDSAIILNPRVWEASGHVQGFTDPLVDCRTRKLRLRADHLADAQCGRKPSKRPGEHSECDLTEARQFNLMFQTQVGALEDASSVAYLRPETAQGIFVNFKNVLNSTRLKLPFGIAQVGKAFRNE